MRKFILIAFVSLFSLSLFAQNKEITLEDVMQKWTFYANSVYGLNSMNDGEHYTVFEKQKIVKYSYKTGKAVETILDCSTLDIGRVSGDYSFNNDETKILLYTNRHSIYRHSFTANFYVYDIKTKKAIPVSEKGKQQLATFSPSSTKIAFVRNNNIFIKNLEDLSEIKITEDGEYNKIINGAPDWVYEEEFGFNKAFEWSPDGKYIAYIKFNESKVKMFSMTLFAGLAPKLEDNVLYPETYTFKYPKAGEDNSIVSVHTYNLENKETKNMDIGKETDIYIPRIRWTKDPNVLSIIRMNRLQNKMEILFANPAKGETKTIYTQKNKYYIEESVLDNLIYLDDNKHFIITSEDDGYRHIYLYTLDGKKVRQITKGEWDVTNFYGYDVDKKLFYYQSAEESSIRRSVYSIDLKGRKKKKLSTNIGTNSAVFSTGYKYYINYFSSASTPTLVTLHDYKGKEIRVLEDNAALKKKIEEYGGVNKEFFTIKTSEGVELNAWMIKPNDFDESKEYPVLVTQYSGPNSQQVLDRWDFGWHQMLAQKGIIVTCVDSRGTGAKGEAFRKVTYKELGKYETIDLIEFAKYLGNQKFIDKKRIGIWGWSYGGFMVANCMTKGADYYSVGISIAPVTNWRYYDNIYTERYMRKPQDNASGYDDNSPINHVDKLKGKLLLIHGSADDNVHVQNSMEFSEALVQAGKQFDYMIYTNRNHGIYGGYTRMHLYTKITNYLLENL